MPKNAGKQISGTQRQGVGKNPFATRKDPGTIFRIAISNRSLKQQKEREKNHEETTLRPIRDIVRIMPVHFCRLQRLQQLRRQNG